MRRWLKIGLAVLVVPVVLVGGYVGAGLGLARIPVNADFRQPADGIMIGVVDNGVHTDLILPVAIGDHDWRTVFPPRAFPRLPAQPGDSHHIVVGWGHRDFYLNTPEWEDLSPTTALRALFGLGGTLLHVYYLPGEAIAGVAESSLAWVRVPPESYARIVNGILTTTRRDNGGRARVQPGAAYGSWDAFFEANGEYGPISTCNEWTRQILADAGIRTGWWTPFSGAILDHLRVVPGAIEFPVSDAD